MGDLKKKRMFDVWIYASDEVISDTLVWFRVNIFYSTVDIITSELNRRFLEDRDENKEQVGLFNNFSFISRKIMK